MPTKKIKLSGQIVKNEQPVILKISEKTKDILETGKEYISVFPNIKLTIEVGNFKIPISKAKAESINRLFTSLNSPMQKLNTQLGNLNFKN